MVRWAMRDDLRGSRLEGRNAPPGRAAARLERHASSGPAASRTPARPLSSPLEFLVRRLHRLPRTLPEPTAQKRFESESVPAATMAVQPCFLGLWGDGSPYDPIRESAQCVGE